MENLKELVRFNRYKSVESFNSATDVTSSTISIVKLDENVMDIYLGRTQLTHSNFPEVNIELRSLIDSLDVKLNNLKNEFNSNLSSIDDKYNKELSKYISDFESGLIDLVNYTDELSKEIFDVKTDIQKKHDDTNNQIKNLTDSISVINDLISNQNNVTNELSNKITEIKSKQTSTTNSIRNLNQDVAALKLEDRHILELISGVQTEIKKISVDISDNHGFLNEFSDRNFCCRRYGQHHVHADCDAGHHVFCYDPSREQAQEGSRADAFLRQDRRQDRHRYFERSRQGGLRRQLR